MFVIPNPIHSLNARANPSLQYPNHSFVLYQLKMPFLHYCTTISTQPEIYLDLIQISLEILSSSLPCPLLVLSYLVLSCLVWSGLSLCLILSCLSLCLILTYISLIGFYLILSLVSLVSHVSCLILLVILYLIPCLLYCLSCLSFCLPCFVSYYLSLLSCLSSSVF